MKKTFAILLTLSAFFGYQSFAQNIVSSDMLRFSQNYSWGTARAMGMGGAFGALGGDMTSLSINPAGIGVYRSSEFVFTPMVSYNTANSNFEGNTLKSEDFSNKFNLSNIGYIYNYNSNKDQGWVSASFGITYNRLNDFNRNVVMKNPSATSSLLDEFVYYANGAPTQTPYYDHINKVAPGNLYEYYENLAWLTYAIDTVMYYDGRYHSDYSFDNTYGQYMERRRSIKGGIGEYAFSFGANYSNKLYLGMTIGVDHVNYNEVTNHNETDQNGTIPNLSSFDFNEHLNIYGTGYNFKFGAIYKPVDMVRLGVAIHSPTFYTLSSEFYTSMDSYFDSGVADGNTRASAESFTRSSTNALNTPWKAIFSGAITFQQAGLISVDYERLNYKNMRLSGDNADQPNNDVSTQYKAVNNLRIGAEGKLDDIAFRVGYGLYSTPYTSNELDYINYTSYSAGVGYRGKSFFIDFAYVMLKYPDLYTLYQYRESLVNLGDAQNPDYVNNWTNDPVRAKTDYTLNKFVCTLGFRF